MSQQVYERVAEQLELPMLTVYHGPSFISRDALAGLVTYRDAVRYCWDHRTRRHLTQKAMARAIGAYQAHLSDYVRPKPGKRDLPAGLMVAFERQCGVMAITQWHNRQAGLTIMEEVVDHQRRLAA